MMLWAGGDCRSVWKSVQDEERESVVLVRRGVHAVDAAELLRYHDAHDHPRCAAVVGVREHLQDADGLVLEARYDTGA